MDHESEHNDSSSSKNLSSREFSTSIQPMNSTTKFPSFIPTSIPSFSFTPGLGLLAASFPLIAGAYIGYRRELTHAQSNNAYMENTTKRTISNLLSNKNTFNSRAVSKSHKNGIKHVPIASKDIILTGAGPSPAFFARALLYGTLLSIGGVSLLSAGAFYATGCSSLEELVQSCREWTPRNRKRLEGFFGVQDTNIKWEVDEDVVATKHMDENQELEYFTKKYAGEDVRKRPTYVQGNNEERQET